MYLRPVNTLKHVVDKQGGIVAGTKQDETLVFGVDNPAHGADVEQCTIGSAVKSIFLNVQVEATTSQALPNVYMIVYGNPGNNIPDSAIPNGNEVGISDFRKQIFHQEMVMVEKRDDGIPRTLFKGVLKIPRKFQRIGATDKIGVNLFTPGVNFNYCIQCIYKEIR